jgi:hypothetical protein
MLNRDLRLLAGLILLMLRQVLKDRVLDTEISLVHGNTYNGRSYTFGTGHNHMQTILVPLYPVAIVIAPVPFIPIAFQILLKNQFTILVNQDGMDLIKLVGVDAIHQPI